MDVLKEIFDLLVALDVVGARVWENRLPQLEQLPCITYSQFGDSPEYYLSGSEIRSELQLQIDVWGKRLSQVKSITSSVRTALSGYSSETIDSCLLNDVTELYELEEGSDSPLYHFVLQFSVQYA